MTDSAQTVSAPTGRQSMEELFEAYGEAWASRDATAIAAFHGEDGLFHLHAASDPVHGRDAIESTFAAFLVQWPDLTFSEQERHLGDWGWVVQWTMSGTLAAAALLAQVRHAVPDDVNFSKRRHRGPVTVRQSAK